MYFHHNSVVDGDFDRLEAGMEMRVTLEMGDQGLQASTVHVVHQHHAQGTEAAQEGFERTHAGAQAPTL